MRYTSKTMKSYSWFLLCLMFMLPLLARAEVVVSPFIVDKETEPRDMFEEVVTIKNETALPTRVFASVNAVEVDEGGKIKSFVTVYGDDRASTITSWIGIDRGRVELPPGAEAKLPLVFNIHPNTKPGIYHAFIGFGAGKNRDEAEAEVLSGHAPGVIVRLSIPDKRTASLRLARFSVDRVLTSDVHDAVSVALTNPGELPLVPDGEIVFYNGRGEEVGTVPLNAERRTVAPGETAEFNSPVTTAGLIGKYKAYVRVAYGEGQTANITDTAFFYVAPLHYLIALFVLLFLLCLGMVFWWRRYVLPEDMPQEGGEHLPVYVRPGAQRDSKDHDITLSQPPSSS